MLDSLNLILNEGLASVVQSFFFCPDVKCKGVKEGRVQDLKTGPLKTTLHCTVLLKIAILWPSIAVFRCKVSLFWDFTFYIAILYFFTRDFTLCEDELLSRFEDKKTLPDSSLCSNPLGHPYGLL